MEFAHLQGTSLIDYPGKVAAVLWTVGCNLRCPFCYNAELVLPELAQAVPRLPEEAVLAQLRERRRFLDGVVITGGEPAIHQELPQFIERVKSLRLLVKLDTNGTCPETLASLLGERLLDYVALDVKAPFSRYPEYSGAPPALVEKVRASLDRILGGTVDHEVRTTAAPGLAKEDLLEVAREVRGAQRYVLQPFFVPTRKRLVDEGWRTRPALSPQELHLVAAEASRTVPCTARA